MSKGGSVPSDTTVRQVGFSEDAEPYFMAMMDDATAVSGQGYTPYTGQRLAPRTDMTLQADRDVRRMANNDVPYMHAATSNTFDVMRNARDAGQQAYDPYQFSQYGGFSPAEFSQYGGFRAGPTNDFSSQFNQFDFGNAAQWNPDVASQYMSPYMQEVVDVQKDQAQLDFERAQQFRDAQAAQSNAFGGSRDAVVNALAQEDLGRSMRELQATGTQRAYEDAARQFQSDRAAQFDWLGAQAGENARYQGDVVGELARAQQARRDEMARVQAGQAGELGRVQAGRAGELGRVQAGEADELARVQASQSAENLAAHQQNLSNYYQSLGMQADMANNLASLGMAKRDYDMMSTDALYKAGQNQQAYRQAQRDISYDDFLRQQNWEQQQLTWLSSILRGIPIEPSYTTTTYTPYNPAQQALGMGIAGIGLQQGLS